MRRKIALVLEYEGTAYAGSQRQANAPTVQAEVEKAVRLLTGTHATVKAAGRTDAGVHAEGQVMAFGTASRLPVETFIRGLNHYLPPDVSVTRAYEVPLGFEPRRQAIARVYRYTILAREGPSALRRRFVYPVPQPLDVAAMAQALGALEGERDFGPFSRPVAPGKSTVRRLYRTAVWREGPLIHLELEGNAFLPQQVRRVAGAVLQVGLGRLTLQEFTEIANSGQQGAARWVLPPQGLCLREVRYPDGLLEDHARTQDDRTYTPGRAADRLARH